MFGFGTNFFGSLVIGAGLVVTSQVPVPPSSTGSVAPYATHAYATGTYGAGQVVTAQVPVPPVGTGSYQPYGTHVLGSGVFGAGRVVTAQVPVPPAPTPTPAVTSRGGGSPHDSRNIKSWTKDDEQREQDVLLAEQDAMDTEEIATVLSLWLNLK